MNDSAFYSILEQVQEYISREYASLLESADNRQLLESYIDFYLRTEHLELEGYPYEALRKRILQEMTGYSFLTEYLAREDVEEININAWEDVKVTYTDGRMLPTPESFRSRQHAVDVVRRMLRESNMVWDNAKPMQVGHLPGNVRITVVGFDVVDEDKALSVSIRKVNSRKLEKEDFVRSGTANEEMLDMLAQMYIHGISMCITGATGSGKTTILSWILAQIPHNKRLITMEHGTREFDCTVRDDNRKILNNVIHLSTRQSDDPKQSIDLSRLLELAMTMDPDFLAVGETKGEEASGGMNAANTGHAVITTTHANSCEDTYYRFISLCKLKLPTMDDAMLMSMVVRAFPIVAYIKKMSDNSRRILQISEACIASDGSVRHRVLFRFVKDETVLVDGKEKMLGHYEKVNPPSEAMQQRLAENELESRYMARFFRKGA